MHQYAFAFGALQTSFEELKTLPLILQLDFAMEGKGEKNGRHGWKGERIVSISETFFRSELFVESRRS